MNKKKNVVDYSNIPLTPPDQTDVLDEQETSDAQVLKVPDQLNVC